MTNMFASYNKNNRQGTLLGNWVEEDALYAATAFSRRKVPTGTLEDDHRASLWESTHDRVVKHTPEHESDESLETTNQALLCKGEDPESNLPTTGPRTKLRDTELMARAMEACTAERARLRQTEERELLEARRETTTKATFQAPPTSYVHATSRVPRGRNGGRIVDSHLLNLTRGEVDRGDQIQLNRVQQSNTYTQGTAVTRYSHAIAQGVGLDFVTSASNSSQPFAKSSGFSNDIHDTTKRHCEATEPGCFHDERPDMTVSQRSALRRLVEACHERPDIHHELVDQLHRESNGENLRLTAFREVIANFVVSLTDKDAIQIFMFFDLDNVGIIPLENLVEYLAKAR